jgi:PAT family beta-lactamase induction signal transducer AmpG
MRVLMLGAILVSLTNLMFMWLAGLGVDIVALTLVIAADNLSGGIAVAAFIAWLSSLTNISFTATQYAIFSSIMTLFPKLLGGYSGTVVESVGYPPFFLLASAMGLPVIALVWYLTKRLGKLG